MSETLDESKRNKRTAKRILAIGLPLVLIGSVGVGYAFFTTTGSGQGTASAGTPKALTLNTGPAAGALSPGTSTTFPVTAANTVAGATSVRVSGITATSVTADASHSACDGVSGFATNLATAVVWAPPAPATSVDVPAGATATPLGVITVTLPEMGINQNACSGATFTVNLSAS